MINLENFVSCLKRGGIEFISGVPDTLLNDFCLHLQKCWDDSQHILAANEGNAIALAAGYHLASETVPLVYMQNSGIGNAMNPLISLTDPSVYSIPMVLLIGWRGEPGSNDWPQHQRQGELSPLLLDTLGISVHVLDADEEASLVCVEEAIAEAKAKSQPVALLVRKGVLAKNEKSGFDDKLQDYELSREDAINEILKNFPEDSVFVGSTGRITRELHAVRELKGEGHEMDFLNVGAMGHSVSIATGIASAKNERNVVCLDGDAAALMHMGSMPISAGTCRSNLFHVVLNNGAHESVGGQGSVAFDINLTNIAKNSGYETIDGFASNATEIEEAIAILKRLPKAKFLEVRIKKGMRKDMPVLKMDPLASKISFTKNLRMTNEL